MATRHASVPGRRMRVAVVAVLAAAGFASAATVVYVALGRDDGRGSASSADDAASSPGSTVSPGAGVSPSTGSSPSPTGSPSPSGSGITSTVDKLLLAGVSAAPGGGLSIASGPTLDSTGLLRTICGTATPSDALLISSVRRTLAGSGDLVVTEKRGVYRPGGVAKLLAEASRTTCGGRVSPVAGLPQYPKGSVLMRSRHGAKATAYVVAPTSPSSAVFLEIDSRSENAIVTALFGAVPGILADAVSDAP